MFKLEPFLSLSNSKLKPPRTKAFWLIIIFTKLGHKKKPSVSTKLRYNSYIY
jgi:hypothetical protein